MLKKKVWLLALGLTLGLAWLILPAFYAQAGEWELTMDDAVARALKTNFNIAIEDINLESKRRQRDMAWNYFLPTMELSGTLNKMNEVTPLYPDHFNISAGLNFVLPLSAQLVYGIRQTFLDYDTGTLSLETAKKKLDLDVRKNFLTLLLLEENIKLIEKNIANAQIQYERAEVNLKNELVDKYTTLAAQVNLETLKPALMEAENTYISVMLVFKTLVGAGRDDTIKLKGSIEPAAVALDVQKLLAAAATGNPDILSLKMRLKALENARGASQAAFYPYLTFLLNFDPTFSKDPFKEAWFSDLDKDWNQKSGNFSLRITMPLHNLIPGSKAWMDMKNTEDQLEQNKLRLEQLLQKTEVDIRLAVLKLKKSEEAIRTYRLSVNLAEKANSMGQAAYLNGVKDYSVIQNTELQLNKAQVDLLKEKYNYATGLLDLAYLLNTTPDKLKD